MNNAALPVVIVVAQSQRGKGDDGANGQTRANQPQPLRACFGRGAVGDDGLGRGNICPGDAVDGVGEKEQKQGISETEQNESHQCTNLADNQYRPPAITVG